MNLDLECLEIIDNPKNGFAILSTPGLPPGRRLVHYKVDAGKDPMTEAGKRWMVEARRGMDSAKWNREYEGDPYSHVGKACHTNFRQPRHVREIEPLDTEPMYIGIDPGIRMAGAVWLQIIQKRNENPRVRIYRELKSVEADMGRMGKKIKEINAEHYPDFAFSMRYEMDIAGKQRGQATGLTVRKILAKFGISPGSGQRSKPDSRITLVNHLLGIDTKEGEPCLLVHPRCQWMISGYLGLYRRKEKSDHIDETEVVHVMDASQYPIWNNLQIWFKRDTKKQDERIEGVLKHLRKKVRGESNEPSYMEC